MHAFPLFVLIVASSPHVDGFAALLAPIPEVGFVLQCAAAGTGLGSAIALRAKRRYRGADVWTITTAWGTLALVLGLVVALVRAVV